MLILVPFYGETEKFRPLLDRWFAAARAAMPNARPQYDFVLLTDSEASVIDAARTHGCGIAEFKLAGFADLMRPGQPFDVKGALVCSFLLAHTYSVLVLDADAFLAKDPTEALAPFAAAPVAMPPDHGALLYGRRPKMDEPYTDVRKLCAGVQWFGSAPGRSRLVAGYRRAYEEIMALAPRVPWTPQLPHLVEQYAWSICSHRRGGQVLPATMNWHAEHLGEWPGVIVNHHYGHPKWEGLPKPDALARRVL